MIMFISQNLLQIQKLFMVFDQYSIDFQIKFMKAAIVVMRFIQNQQDPNFELQINLQQKFKVAL